MTHEYFDAVDHAAFRTAMPTQAKSISSSGPVARFGQPFFGCRPTSSICALAFSRNIKSAKCGSFVFPVLKFEKGA